MAAQVFMAMWNRADAEKRLRGLSAKAVWKTGHHPAIKQITGSMGEKASTPARNRAA
jgi:hypothetical protein